MEIPPLAQKAVTQRVYQVTIVSFWQMETKGKKKITVLGWAAGKPRVNLLSFWNCNGFGQGDKWKFYRSSSCRSSLSWIYICICCSISTHSKWHSHPSVCSCLQNVWEAAFLCWILRKGWSKASSKCQQGKEILRSSTALSSGCCNFSRYSKSVGKQQQQQQKQDKATLQQVWRDLLSNDLH